MRSSPTDKRSNSAGFTLLEMIGVMVIISILFAAAVPSLVNLIRTQRSMDERLELPKIAAALKLGILREQRFPVYENATAVDGKAKAKAQDTWWNLAARHGAGSANEVRYPLGAVPDPDEVALGKVNTRKLYFAKASWSDRTFFEITGDGEITDDQISNGWLANPLDPTELRLLLISTTNPGLSLPGTLSPAEFDAFWNHWAVGSDGDPVSGVWGDYGLTSKQWIGRASELNIERIDLRDWLCAVVIENRRALSVEIGKQLNYSNFPLDEIYNDTRQVNGRKSTYSSNVPSNQDWVPNTLYTYTTHQMGTEVLLIINTRIDTSTPEPGVEGNFYDLNANGLLDSYSTYTVLEGFIVVKLGRIQRNNLDHACEIIISGTRLVGGLPQTELVKIELEETFLAPIDVLDARGVGKVDLLDTWSPNLSGLMTPDFVKKRHFLMGQSFLLGDPRNPPGSSDVVELGEFTITENFSTLRFDGLQWHY